MNKLLSLSPELIAALDAARGKAPFANWVEHELWRLKSTRDGAAEAGVENPGRPLETRGGKRQKRATR